MIGVIADPADHDVVREFFELFKTPWEFYRGNQLYDVVICANEGRPYAGAGARLVIVCAGRKTTFDDEQKVTLLNQRTHSCFLAYRENRIPIYGDSATFETNETILLRDERSQECAAYLEQIGGTFRARVGYDIFGEIRRLLTEGQPSINAAIPSLELHITFLRELLASCGVEFVEIPPMPEGFRFIVCLTHDVDHPAIRTHKWDHTTLGFLSRGIFGSLWSLIRGRISFGDTCKNWAAAIKLPFLHIGFVKDFWADFDDRYLELEEGLASTFFVIPFKDTPGKIVGGSAPDFRASRYDAKELASTIGKLAAAGCEIGLHGIDAWLDSSKGREELEEIRHLTGNSEIGVRMHWLYYDRQSPAALEKAGAAYDSTIGYNETVGYRAGTTQVYRPLELKRLLELPMHAMDTALFFPTHLALSPKEASARLRRLADNAAQFGGCLTVNWHDRSLAPERLWGRCYRDLIEDLKNRGAWFATASQATDWFGKRRSAMFETREKEPGVVCEWISANKGENLPGLRMRIHNSSRRAGACMDVSIKEDTHSGVAFEA